MDTDIYLSKLYNIAYKLDYDDNLIISYDYRYIDDILSFSSEGILQELNVELVKELEEHFSISLSDFGVVTIEEPDIEEPTIKPISPKKEYDKALQRLITIIIRIQSKELPTTKELAQEFNVSERTIQTDIYKRLTYLPIYKDSKHRFYFPDDYSICSHN